MSLTSRVIRFKLGSSRSSSNLCDAVTRLQSARNIARAWSASIDEGKRQQSAWAFIKIALDEYMQRCSRQSGREIAIAPSGITVSTKVNAQVISLARTIGEEAVGLSMVQACYQLSSTYAALVPQKTRSALGMYYTPPVLTDRLLVMASEAGVDWRTAHVLDPACGGGAFLLPAALRMREAMRDRSATEVLGSIAKRIKGFEIDPFAAELAQTWLELALGDLTSVTGELLPRVVQVCDALEQEPQQSLFDLVIGNPPYGRTTLSPVQRERFARSLYGHANLYGVFTDIGLRWTRSGGIIAYVTPTSFLAGEYFKALRDLIAYEAPPLAINFINARRGVFEDVLQETLLATYRKNHKANGTTVHHLNVSSELQADIAHAGELTLPPIPASPWFAPRLPSHQLLINRIARMPNRLRDWGYRVSTGPLVWNRHKAQLRSRLGPETFPLIWAEAITPGRFEHRADKRNHAPYFRIDGEADEWLKVEVPCVLVQRTTAKEQARRLIAAELPASFIQRHGAVVVENHLNMIRQANGVAPAVSPAALAALLNSEIVDEVFRCISGSVSVSAFELESLPLPSPKQMAKIDALVGRGKSSYLVGASIRTVYFADDYE